MFSESSCRLAIKMFVASIFGAVCIASPNSSAGIRDLYGFLDVCPTDDPIFAKLSTDFIVKVQHELIDPSTLTCTTPMTSMSVEDLNDGLLFYQALRLIYYLDFAKSGHLPWTDLSLYDWLRQGIDGATLFNNYPGGSCCITEDGKKLITAGTRGEATAEERVRGAPFGFITILTHETRHTDPDDPGHVSDCCGSSGCDQQYDLDKLGAYGVTRWLKEQFATRGIDFGGCGELDNLQWWAREANNLSRKICDSPPMDITEKFNGLTCGSDIFENRSTLTGLWFDPELDGEGFNFIIDDSTAIVIYYGYSQMGERLWLLSEPHTGELQAGKAVTLSMAEFSGGVFDSPKPGHEAQLPWGTVSLLIDECGTGVVKLWGLDGDKRSDVVPLITAASHECAEH